MVNLSPSWPLTALLLDDLAQGCNPVPDLVLYSRAGNKYIIQTFHVQSKTTSYTYIVFMFTRQSEVYILINRYSSNCVIRKHFSFFLILFFKKTKPRYLNKYMNAYPLNLKKCLFILLFVYHKRIS